MSTETMSDLQKKDILKQAIFELVQEKKEFFSDLFMEAMEDVALAKAIEEGMQSETVNEDEVFQILEGTI